jgi:DNA replication protein DnaC
MDINQQLEQNLDYLKLTSLRDNYANMARDAAENQLSHLDFLASVIADESAAKQHRAAQRRIKQAKFPVIKTLDQFIWSHPAKINRDQIQHLFTLNFIRNKENIIFLGNPGLGKTHLMTAIAYQACTKGHSVRFDTAVNIINRLNHAVQNGKFSSVLREYLATELLCIDELGFLPIDQHGADLLFQVVSGRYERNSTIITTNRQFNKWNEIFNNDNTITSAILDRLLHHCEKVLIEGESFRMRAETI